MDVESRIKLLLGVSDGGEVVGIDPAQLDRIKKEFVTTINNPQKISPPSYLKIDEIQFQSKALLYVFVPPSSQVHRCNNRIYDRNEDGDFDITDNTQQVAALYQRKQTTYTENRLYRYVKLKHLRKDLIARARKLAGNQQPGHPWLEMDDLELLKSAQLYTRDFQTGEQGFTLAAVLLFGQDEVILSTLPHHRTDALLRKVNLDRYDDRDDIRTNLIESYDRLMAFVQKHLPDPFFQEGDQRISLRDHIFREVVANTLIHREYMNPYPAKFIIEPDRVFCENSNKPHGYGLISPENFSPYPKNPIIARFFREIGRADELGSGVRKLYKYSMLYGGGNAAMVEADIFKVTVPLVEKDTSEVSDQANDQVTPQAVELLEFCFEPKSRDEIQALLGLKDRKYFRTEILKPLLKQGLLKPTIPEKPTSPKQKYFAVPPRDEEKS